MFQSKQLGHHQNLFSVIKDNLTVKVFFPLTIKIGLLSGNMTLFNFWLILNYVILPRNKKFKIFIEILCYFRTWPLFLFFVCHFPVFEEKERDGILLKTLRCVALSIYLPLKKKFYLNLDKANWSQTKMEISYIYVKP